MQAEIDNNGILHLRREYGKMVKVYCPLNPFGLGCGTWCALFDYYNDPANGYIIRLCHDRKYVIRGSFKIGDRYK